MQTQSLDLIARLLATENLNVVRANVSTAGFDLASRTLVLPQWKNTSLNVDQMLVAHEVGHALFTPSEYTEAGKRDSTAPYALKFRGASAYLNVIEDVRIEKLIKRRYPGIRRVMTLGYRELNDLDFFGIKKLDLRALPLIDRINLYFKCGYGCGVEFSRAEKEFVNRAEQTETIFDCIELARDIYEFSKQAVQEQQQLTLPEAGEDAQDDDDDAGDFDLADDDYGDDSDFSDEKIPGGTNQIADNEDDDSSDDTNQPSSAPGADNNDPFAVADEGEQSITVNAFEERVRELADTETTYRYYTIGKMTYNPVVSFQQVLSYVTEKSFAQMSILRHPDVVSFKHNTQNNVDYLVKEFEMRKAATSYKRSQTAKIGSLDMKKVWSYKLSNDLFKRVTAVKEGKNHGMIFLLDWSGSMSGVIGNTLDQTINLAMFCQRAHIPYRVYAFSDDGSLSGWKNRPRDVVYGPNEIDVNQSSLSLIELFSDRMSTSEFNQMVAYARLHYLNRVYGMSGTPLNEALVAVYQTAEKFISENNIEKLSLICLTDGAGNQLDSFYPTEYNYETGRQHKIRHFITDPVAKKNYEVTKQSSTHTSAILQMIKSKFDCAVVGFYLTRNRLHNLEDVLRTYFDSTSNKDWQNWRATVNSTIATMRKDFSKNGYGSLTIAGYDEMFIVPIENTRVVDGSLEVDGDASARAIASKFTKYMTTKKTSRILLNKFVGYVA